MRVLMVGDIVGKSGRRALTTVLPRLRRERDIDFVVVNGENAAGGYGLTLDTADEILAAGADVITSGNHIWDQRDFISHLDGEMPILRPANYPGLAPGRGHLRLGDVAVINIQGRVFMPEGVDSPFEIVERVLAELEQDPPKVTLVDFHTEATSEQGAMGWFLDGRISMLVGTHTHVATADTRVLPKGTAFVTDLGMTGPVNSVLGMKVDDVLARFLTGLPKRLNAVENGPARFNSVLAEIDDSTGLAVSVERVDEVID